VKNPNNVLFVFEVGEMEKARAFIHVPDAEEAGTASGIIDGEYHFVEDSQRY
jgi:hypothetical protein